MKMAISPSNISGKYCSDSWMTQDFQMLDHNAISNDLYGNCFQERNDGRKVDSSAPYLQCNGIWKKRKKKKSKYDTNAIHLFC